jgi:CubicO group peptidase (beta-lactamase class C family)
MRLQLADGQFAGRRIVDAKALAETHSPEILIGSNPQNPVPMFYGLGWFVSYDKEGRPLIWHNGIFTSGAATIVQLVPSEHLGIVVLTNAFPPGVGEGLAFMFTTGFSTKRRRKSRQVSKRQREKSKTWPIVLPT